MMNDYQKNELLESIINDHEIPHKFCYLDEDGSVWNSIANDSDFDLAKRELFILSEFLKMVSAKLEDNPFNIVHIGPGNGKEIPTIIDTLGIGRIDQFALVDINIELLAVSKSYGNEQFKDMLFPTFCHDMCNTEISNVLDSLNEKGTNANIILITANGGLLSNSSVFANIRESISPKDKLFITLETYSADKEHSILNQFKSLSITKLFANGVSHIGINDATPEHFEFEYNKEKSMVEGYFLTTQWLESHNFDNTSFDFKIPDKIKIFSTLRPTPSKLRDVLISNGYKIELFHHFEPEDCCGILCSAKSDNWYE